MAKVAKNLNTDNMSYEDIVKILKNIKSDSATYIGRKEIAPVFSTKKILTGIPTVDFLSSGGITKGRITIFAGNVSSSKTTQSLQIVAAAQKVFKEEGTPKMCLWYDVEGAYDSIRAEQLGVDQNYMIIKRSKVIEDVFAEIDDLVSTGFIGFLVIDSLDALVPRKVDESDYGNTMGGASGAVAMHLPKLFNKIMEHEVTTIFIKQCRVKFSPGAPGEVLTFSGGKALRHFADSIFMVNRLSNKNLSYVPIKVKAEKTRSARMGLTLEMPLAERGIDRVRDSVHLAIEHGVIVQGGAWLTYFDGNEDIKVNGVEKMVTLFRSNPSKFEEFYEMILKRIIYSEEVIGNSTDELIVKDED